MDSEGLSCIFIHTNTCNNNNIRIGGCIGWGHLEIHPSDSSLGFSKSEASYYKETIQDQVRKSSLGKALAIAKGW